MQREEWKSASCKQMGAIWKVHDAVCIYYFFLVGSTTTTPLPPTLEYYVDLTDLPAPKKRRELHQLSGNSSESNLNDI